MIVLHLISFQSHLFQRHPPPPFTRRRFISSARAHQECFFPPEIHYVAIPYHGNVTIGLGLSNSDGFTNASEFSKYSICNLNT